MTPHRPIEHLGKLECRHIVGKLVRILSAVNGGGFVALVRRAGRSEALVQRPGGALGARSLSGRCRGERLRVSWTWVQGRD